uniref:Large ribosomal subunit protein uL24c n=1 Tax=Alsidium seaforthii TaxID=2007182 RepID=A0A1Z1MDY0_9FLOR|nr:ribosomal protein L24 [Bryothamnion seaforthii]ARW63991.1 ribosomal protein L24 [Bryothamnion seaforthii]
MKERIRIKIKIGDSVKVISGKNKGQIGTVKKIINNQESVILENINTKTKHMKPKQTDEKGYIQQIEGRIHYSNIKIIAKDIR